MGCLYQIEFANGKSYLGITEKESSERLKKHLYDSIKCLKQNRALHSALRKYPNQYTVKELAWSDDWKVLCRIEKQAIKVFNTKVPGGYNMTDGGDGLVGPTEETRKRMGQRHLGNQYAKGHKLVHTEETKRKIGKAHKGNKYALGLKLSEESRSKISNAVNKGNRFVKGHKHSEESKRKMSESHKRRFIK